MPSKKTLWISHSAISSFAKCPHLYYLEYEYRNPQTGNRIQITNPYFALGLSVHETLEGLLSVSPKKRTQISLKDRFSQVFENYRGLKGGFISQKKEEKFYKRGLDMVERVERSTFLSRPSMELNSNFPTVNLFEKKHDFSKKSEIDMKLVGSVDWIEVLPDGGAHIIDFKTGNNKEKNNSLQLPIYTILAQKNIKEAIRKTSYWYLEHDDSPMEHKIGDIDYWMAVIKEKAMAIKEAVEKKDFSCNYPRRCFACGDYDKIFNGDAEKVEAENSRGKDVFCIFKEEDIIEKIMENDFLDEREKKIFSDRLERTMSEINTEMRLTEEKSKKIVEEIKEKLKNNLRQKELKIVVRLLSKRADF